MKTKKKQELLSYKEHLDSLTKDNIVSILDIYNIEYKKKTSKDKLIQLIIDNIDTIIKTSISLFQKDELYNIKYVIKKKGIVKIRINNLLYNFLLNLVRVGQIKQINEKDFIMPKELLQLYQKEIKKKTSITKITLNTKEYELIMGSIDTYGLILFDDFYQNYSKDYKVSSKEALERISSYARFFNEFKITYDKDKVYLQNNNVNYNDFIKKIKKTKLDYVKYTNSELISIRNIEYLRSFKSYKKLIKYVKRNYIIQNDSLRVFNKCILIPYFETIQLDKVKGEELLSSLLDKYFEFNNSKHKNKFMNLIKETALDYPRWDLKGHSEREIVC